MKKLLSALLSAAILLSFSSCSKEEPKEPTPAELAVAIADEGRIEEAYYKLKELAEAGDAEAKEKLEAFSLVYTKHTQTQGPIRDGKLHSLSTASENRVYDESGFLLKYSRSKDNTKTAYNYIYDEHGYLIKIDPVYLSGHTEYFYDQNGYLEKYVDYKNPVLIQSTKEYVRDSLGRILKETHTDEKGSVETHEYTYDTNGNLTSELHTNKHAETSSAEYTYDTNGNLTSELHTNKHAGTSSAEYTYDTNGKITKEVHVNYSGQETTIEYTYNDSGKLTREKNSNGITNDYFYSDDGKLIRKIDQTKKNITAYNYFYDEHGNLIKESKNEDNRNFSSILYEYDANGNMTRKAWGNNAESAEEYEEYVYDSMGNLLKKTQHMQDSYEIVDEYDGYKIFYHPNKPKKPDI